MSKNSEKSTKMDIKERGEESKVGGDVGECDGLPYRAFFSSCLHGYSCPFGCRESESKDSQILVQVPVFLLVE
jgi:hypothetical protein